MRYQAKLKATADFGLALQQARMAKGLSQKEVADILNVGQSTVSDLESGKATIYLSRILEMSKAIGLELSASWEDEDAAER